MTADERSQTAATEREQLNCCARAKSSRCRPKLFTASPPTRCIRLRSPKIFEAKERPRFDPLIVHLPDRDWLEKVADLPDRQSTGNFEIGGSILARPVYDGFAQTRNRSRYCHCRPRHSCRSHQRASDFCRNHSASLENLWPRRAQIGSVGSARPLRSMCSMSSRAVSR